MLSTASLRKALLGLFVLMALGVMFIYWNGQEGGRPASSQLYQAPAISSNSHPSAEKIKLTPEVPIPSVIPPETIWTYKCASDKCVRHHYLEKSRAAGEKRVPYQTCAMTCGTDRSLIVPHPTVKNILGAKTLTFDLDSIHTHIATPHLNAEKLFREAVLVFLHDLSVMDATPSTNTHSEPSQPVDNHPRQSRMSKRHSPHGDASEAVGEVFSERTGGGGGKDGGGASQDINREDSQTGFSSYNSKCKTKHCDIDKFNIRVTIDKSDEVYLALDTDERYNLSIEHFKSKLDVKIQANTFFGARHGLATLTQLIWYDDEVELLRILDQAIVVDEPKFRYRGLMLDTSRHYFSVDAIKRQLHGMSLSKLNHFHWHITDTQSFPYVSAKYPQMADYGAYSSRETYTMADIKAVADYARVRGIQVVPEIDAPAHAGNGWDWGPKHGLGELSLCVNQQPWSFYCGEPPCGQLNPKNNNTYSVLQRLYAELLEMIGPSDFFHLGGDEVNLECWSQHFNDTDLRGLWCDFMLQSYQRLKLANQGVAPRNVMVWSSGLTASPCLSRNSFVVQVWGGSTWQENFDLIENGYNVIMSHVDAWYLDCGFGRWRQMGEPACSPYRTWQNVYKHRPWSRMRLTTPQMKQVLGGEACMWTEQVDESMLDSRMWPRSAALAERLWSDPDDEMDFELVPRQVFKRMSIFRNRLVALGITAEPMFPKYCAQNEDECI